MLIFHVKPKVASIAYTPFYDEGNTIHLDVWRQLPELSLFEEYIPN